MACRTDSDVRDQAVVGFAALDDLVRVLRGEGYRVIGPTVRDGAVVLDEIESAAALPHGRAAVTGPGGYRLVEREDGQVFANAVGPMAWKYVLRPPREKLLGIDRTDIGFDITRPDLDEEPPLALLGVRPCDLRALTIQDAALAPAGSRSPYAQRRARAFIVAVDCTEPAPTCFCLSAGGGPCAESGFDLALTEVVEGQRGHRFLVRVGSAHGARVLAAVPHGPGDHTTARAAREAVDAAAAAMKDSPRSLPEVDLRALLTASRDATRWHDIAERCLACGNCTLVCPTCFCADVEDVTDLTGDHAERWQRWASCFDLDFSYIHGGEVRTGVESRYRQWLTHKLGTWYDQFGTSGCVGCGRCVAWCPAGIDLTEEVRALRDEKEVVP